MTQLMAVQDVIVRLERLQATDDVSKEARKSAKAIVSRLSSPVRVTLLGPVGVGKSTLCNILADQAVVPIGQKLPTTMLQFGDRGRITATLGDRSVRIIEGLDFSGLHKIVPALVEVEAPLKKLKGISLLEIVTDGTPNELAAALKWAATRTDIAIWVTTEFTIEERAVWANMPDDLKDHAYLVLNKIDLLGQEERETRTARLQAIAAQSFRTFFAVSASAPANQGKGGAAIEAGSYEDLLKTLRRHIDLAAQADLDGALMFLSRFEAHDRAADRVEARPPTTDGSQSVQKNQEAGKTRPTDPKLQVEEIVKPENGPDDAQQRDARRAALERLRICANGLLSDWTYLGGNVAETVLDRCMETAEDLSAALPPEDQFCESVLQASDLIVLLHLEKSDAAAENAVTTLLQLKKDFEVALAA